MPSQREKTTLVRQVLRRLEQQHGVEARPAASSPQAGDDERGNDNGGGPLEQVLFGILSRGTSARNALQALHRLRTEFTDLNEVRVSTSRQVAEAIQTVADPEAKAVAILALLKDLFLKRHGVNLDFLRRLPEAEARAFLERLVLEYPRSALVPQARRELDRLLGRVPRS